MLADLLRRSPERKPPYRSRTLLDHVERGPAQLVDVHLHRSSSTPSGRVCVADLLDQTLSEIRARLKELRPLVAEYERLELAVKALGGLEPNSRATTSRRARRRSSGRRGDTKERFVAFLKERPGVSVAEVSKGIDIPNTYGHNLASRLTKDGVIERFELPSGRKGLRLVEAKSAGASKTAAKAEQSRAEGKASGAAQTFIRE
jgi:hypothetical protein